MASSSRINHKFRILTLSKKADRAHRDKPRRVIISLGRIRINDQRRRRLLRNGLLWQSDGRLLRPNPLSTKTRFPRDHDSRQQNPLVTTNENLLIRLDLRCRLRRPRRRSPMRHRTLDKPTKHRMVRSIFPSGRCSRPRSCSKALRRRLHQERLPVVTRNP